MKITFSVAALITSLAKNGKSRRKHTIYSLDTITKPGKPVTVCYRREGMFTYEKLFVFDDHTEDLIRWEDGELVYISHKYEYSPYEK